MSNEITYLIEKQAARIAELEAERDNFHMEYRMKCDVETKQLHEQLAALRRKIDEQEKAEPVAIVCKDGTLEFYRPSSPRAEALLFTHSAPVPAGWQLVPVEPTKAMLSAGWGNDHLYADLYKAMLQAAPKPGEMK